MDLHSFGPERDRSRTDESGRASHDLTMWRLAWIWNARAMIITGSGLARDRSCVVSGLVSLLLFRLCICVSLSRSHALLCSDSLAHTICMRSICVIIKKSLLASSCGRCSTLCLSLIAHTYVVIGMCYVGFIVIGNIKSAIS